MRLSLVGAAANAYLSSWMGLAPLQSQTLLDLALPGSHDTMTYDLSTTVSQGADVTPILKWLPRVVTPGDWIRTQATTQKLTVTEQLDNGIRFLDFRIMQEKDGEWYCLHTVHTNSKALDYLAQVKAWVVAHPTEVIVLYFTKHGKTDTTGTEQFPKVSVEAKRAFWAAVEQLFGPLLVDHSTHAVNAASIGALVEAGQRVVVYTADHAELTGGSALALDTRLNMVSEGYSSVKAEPSSVVKELNMFKGARERLVGLKASNTFWLASFANSQPSKIITDCAYMHFGVSTEDHRKSCVAQMHMPDGYIACPTTLLAYGQLTAYYKQLSLDAAFEAKLDFPNAIYIDDIDAGGTIRTGTQLLNSDEDCAVWKYTGCLSQPPASVSPGWYVNGSSHGSTHDTDGTYHGRCGVPWQSHYRRCRSDPHATERFGFVDTLVAHNVRKACQAPSKACSVLPEALARRQLFPQTLWDDAATGRHAAWPAVPRPRAGPAAMFV